MSEIFSKGWYTTHLRAIRQLVQEPQTAEPRPGEPILDVLVTQAELMPGPHMENPLVRFVIDDQIIDETEPFTGPNLCHPEFFTRFLALPRGAGICRFQLWSGYAPHIMRGECLFNAETLWRTARKCGQLGFDMPLLWHGKDMIGILRLHIKEWDGLEHNQRQPVTHWPSS
mmetsp:Transcript_40814/g.108165  ORF Transcript_40814/g.108165 Transcript_40814/m.108165 type:complete len:171 (-) Transcript_40814:84-596(-)